MPEEKLSRAQSTLLNEEARQRASRFVKKKLEEEERAKPHAELVVTSAASVQRIKQERIFGGRLERGSFSFIVGQGEAGKGVVSSDIMARLTTGSPFPGENGHWREPMRVLVCIIEDSQEQVVGRLEAAGADLNLVDFITGPPIIRGGLIMSSAMRLDSDAAPLVNLAKKLSAGAIFIETLVEHLGDRDSPKNISTNNEADVRAALSPFRAICKEANLFGWALIHPRKGSSGDINEQISGSAAFYNIPRLVLYVFKDPEDQSGVPKRLLASGKANNLPRRPMTYRFGIESWEKDRDYPRAMWGVEGKSLEDERSADDILDQIRDKGRKRKDLAIVEAEEFLRETLGNGEKIPPEQIKIMALERGINGATLDKAKRNLGLVSIREKKVGPKVLGWEFPESEV